MNTRERAIDALAGFLARKRFGPGVDMGGRHNPTPGEYLDARRFVDDMIHVGWTPPVQPQPGDQ